MKIKELMTQNPGFAYLNSSLPEVAKMMADYDCGSIPIVENATSMKPMGVVTDRDITIRTVSHGKDPLNMVAGEIMTEIIITVTPETSVEECLDKMEKNQIRRILVVDEAGNLCGMVSQADIARKAPASVTAEFVKDVSKTAKA